jgi:DNA polymerase-3 subunit epsilon
MTGSENLKAMDTQLEIDDLTFGEAPKVEQPLWAEGRLLGLDLETTSADPLTAQPVSYGLSDFSDGELQSSTSVLVKPTVPIYPGAIAVHGITEEAVLERGIPLETAIAHLKNAILEASANGVPLVGMNVRFDLIIVDVLAHSLFGEGLAESGWRGPVIDIAVIDRYYDKWRKGKRRLEDLCGLTGVDPGNAHDAAADACASVRIAIDFSARYPEIATMTPRELTEQQIQWRKEWYDDYSQYRAGKGESPMPEYERYWPLSAPFPELLSAESDIAITTPAGITS